MKMTNDPGAVRFKCPNCGKADIVRSKHNRITVVRYTCPECSFEGPN